MTSGRLVQQAVRDGVFVVPVINERIGNNILQVYRGFWFAAVHGIPREHVLIKPNGHMMNAPELLMRVRDNFISEDTYQRLPMAASHICPCSMTSVPDGRRALVDFRMPERGCVSLHGAGFLYPELPWEKSLFVHLFDNPEMRKSLAERYARQLCGNTIGYTVRRGDFMHVSDRKSPTKEALVSDIMNIVARHYGMVKVIVTSDDPDFVDGILSENKLVRDYVYVFRGTVVEMIYLLSMCDYVISNGQCHATSCWVNDPGVIWDSTFGQIAQALNRSYKYADVPPVPPADGSAEMTRSGCDCTYPTRNSGF